MLVAELLVKPIVLTAELLATPIEVVAGPPTTGSLAAMAVAAMLVLPPMVVALAMLVAAMVVALGAAMVVAPLDPLAVSDPLASDPPASDPLARASSLVAGTESKREKPAPCSIAAPLAAVPLAAGPRCASVRVRVGVSRPHGQGTSRVHCAARSLESPPEARAVRCGSIKTALTSRHVSAHMATCAFRAPPFAPLTTTRRRRIQSLKPAPPFSLSTGVRAGLAPCLVTRARFSGSDRSSSSGPSMVASTAPERSSERCP